MHFFDPRPLLAVAGPIFPAGKSFVLLTGDGYIAGRFIASILLPDFFDRRPENLSREEVQQTEAENEFRYRRGGILAALALAVAWGFGTATHGHQYPVFPTPRDLFSAVPMLGLGACAATIYAKIAARLSKPAGRVVSLRMFEHKTATKMEVIASCVFFWGYVITWL